ncbi:YicC/YloC family endoribonuclease [Oceanibium sediminis]|uniref:YicC/YloC family endoribonuclease n=1 Tax=Oceanibium sediminis TaxID=2026339 RepID=UPI001E476971|nr:YicC/YloC family endoribonuclease [Oceanibium sediminis]
MTGFASQAGHNAALTWQWEVRAVNARGLDLRVRLPDGLEALEPKVRGAAQAALARGALQVSLRVSLAEEDAGMALNHAAFTQLLAITRDAAEQAAAAGVDLTPASIDALLSQRGILETRRMGAALAGAADEIAADLPALFGALNAQRAIEGAALEQVLRAQVDKVAALTAGAAETAEARSARSGELLAARVAALTGQASVEPERLAQELALLAVKSDITEEIDRLNAHVGAARGHLDSDAPVGRQLDFLMQEFNREANTLCSKAQDSALTAIGLDLKVVIDQMREQCANVE